MGPGPKYGENQLSSDKQLSIDGMQSLLQSIPGTGTYHAADSLLRDMFDEVDEDDSGRVDLHEFMTMISSRIPLPEDAEDRNGRDIVLAAVESLRAEVETIYGVDDRTKGRRQVEEDRVDAGQQRCCFFQGDGDSLSSKLRLYWDLVQVLLLGYVAIAVPYRTCFDINVDTNSPWFWFEVGLDVYFAVDIVLNFRTGYRDDDGPSKPSSFARFLPVAQYLRELASGFRGLECGVLTSPGA